MCLDGDFSSMGIGLHWVMTILSPCWNLRMGRAQEFEPAECLEHSTRGLCMMLLYDGCGVKPWLNFLNHTDSWKDRDKTPTDFIRNKFRPQVRVTKSPVTQLEQKFSDFCYYLNKKIHLFSPSWTEAPPLPTHLFFFPEVVGTVYLWSQFTLVVWILAHFPGKFSTFKWSTL